MVGSIDFVSIDRKRVKPHVFEKKTEKIRRSTVSCNLKFSLHARRTVETKVHHFTRTITKRGAIRCLAPRPAEIHVIDRSLDQRRDRHQHPSYFCFSSLPFTASPGSPVCCHTSASASQICHPTASGPDGRRQEDEDNHTRVVFVSRVQVVRFRRRLVVAGVGSHGCGCPSRSRSDADDTERRCNRVCRLLVQTGK